MADYIQTRRGASADWAATDFVLRLGEPGLDTDLGLVKYGDGSTPWSGLQFSGESILTAVGLPLQAPPPSGVAAIDTPILQALLTQAQSTGTELRLQAGTYAVTNLTTTQSFTQPRIVGAGKQKTFIKGTTTGSALMLKGGSGSLSGGYIGDLGFIGTGTGIEFQGCGGVEWSRLSFDGGLSVGILFHNKDAGEFTEYCTGDADFGIGCATALKFHVTSGNESFHGCGLTGQSTVNQAGGATVPSILIDSGAIVYNSPLDVTFWIRTAGQPLIRTNSTRWCMFHGVIRTELFADTGTIVDPASAVPINLVGGILSLGGTAARKLARGALEIVQRAEANGAGLATQRAAAGEFTLVGNTKTTISKRQITPTGTIVSLLAIGPNYTYIYTLLVHKSPFNESGWVTQLANPLAQNNSGWGAPTFTVENGQLQMLNANYPSTPVVEVSVGTIIFPEGNLI